MSVNCEACMSVIQVGDRGMQYCVKCAMCKELTPIRPAPPGKKFIRCKCKCLVLYVYEEHCTLLICPRLSCRGLMATETAQSFNPEVPDKLGDATEVTEALVAPAVPAAAAAPAVTDAVASVGPATPDRREKNQDPFKLLKKVDNLSSEVINLRSETEV
ncbi:hypothetical protein PFISCL1PPCAC_9331, partial [Pristionchus fissidentatus]